MPVISVLWGLGLLAAISVSLLWNGSMAYGLVHNGLEVAGINATGSVAEATDAAPAITGEAAATTTEAATIPEEAAATTDEALVTTEEAPATTEESEHGA